MDSMKSVDGGTQWYIDGGCLSEVGPTSFKVNYGIADTRRLRDLLNDHWEEIEAVYFAELAASGLNPDKDV
jgi:hypothetical protein